MEASGLGSRQGGGLKFHHQLTNSPGLHPCFLPLLCCLQVWGLSGSLSARRNTSPVGAETGGVCRALGGSDCSLHRSAASPSLPLTLSESLLLWHLILPVHGSFWGSAGELACLSWCPLEGTWVFAASVLPSRLPTLHLPSISLDCVDTLDPLLSPFPFALSLWVYTRDHPSTVIRSETRCSVLHVKGPCPLRVVLAGHCPALLPGTCSPVFSSSLLFLGSLSVLLALSLSCFFLFLSFLVCRKKCLTMQF